MRVDPFRIRTRLEHSAITAAAREERKMRVTLFGQQEVSMTLRSMKPVAECPCNEDPECQECCPHDEHDHGICLSCGKDRTDDLVCAAEYAFEGDR